MVWYKIDEISKKTGLTKRTLRFYEEIGLLPPPERSEGRFRLYSEEDLKRIQEIILAKEVLGFSLQELQHFLELKHSIHQDLLDPEKVSQVETLLQEQIDMLTEKQERMKKFQQELQELLQEVRRKKE